MLLILFLTLMPSYAVAGKYDEAVKYATTAALRQSGLEADYLKARGVAKTKVVKFVQENRLETPFTVISVAAPILLKKQIKVRTKGFVFKGNESEVSLTWQLGF